MDSLSKANASTGSLQLREVVVHRVPPDGSCWYSAVAGALGGVARARLRVEVAAFVARNPSERINGAALRDWVAWDSGLDVRAYARRMFQEGAWAGGLENAVLARLYDVAVEIWVPGRAWRRIARFVGDAPSTGVVRLAYSGGCHYDWLEVLPRMRAAPKDWACE